MSSSSTPGADSPSEGTGADTGGGWLPLQGEEEAEAEEEGESEEVAGRELAVGFGASSSQAETETSKTSPESSSLQPLSSELFSAAAG